MSALRFSPIRYIPYVFKKSRPIQLTFFITSRCNARCRFCFYKKETEQEKELTIDEIRSIASEMDSLLWFALSGGEVFLRNDLVEIVEVFYQNTTPAIILIPTNGFLSEKIRDDLEKILRICKNSTIVLKLSLDAVGEKHDELRGVNGGFERVLRTYYLIKDLLKRYGNLEIGINTVLCSENKDYIPDVVNFVRDMKAIRTHTISLVRGSQVASELKDITASEYKKVTGLLKNSAGVYSFRGAKIKTAQDSLQRKIIYKTLSQNKKQIDCLAGRLTVVIDEWGNVYPCESFDHKIGNLRDTNYSLKRLLKSYSHKEIKRMLRGCFCTHECYIMMNILFSPRHYPALLREYLSIHNQKRLAIPLAATETS